MRKRIDNREPVIDALLEEALGGVGPRDMSEEILARAEHLKNRDNERQLVALAKAEEEQAAAQVAPQASTWRLLKGRERAFIAAASVVAVLSLGAALFFSGNSTEEGQPDSDSHLAQVDNSKEQGKTKAFVEQADRAFVKATFDKAFESAKDRPSIFLGFDGTTYSFELAETRDAVVFGSARRKPRVEILVDGAERRFLRSEGIPQEFGSGDWVFVPSSDRPIDLPHIGTIRGATGPMLIWHGDVPNKQQLEQVRPWVEHLYEIQNTNEGIIDMKNWQKVGAYSVLLLSGTAVLGGNQLQAQEAKEVKVVKRVVKGENAADAMKKLFELNDKNSDGFIDSDEMPKLIVDSMDTNKDGKVSLDEYKAEFEKAEKEAIKIVKEGDPQIEKAGNEMAFKLMDTNNDGFIEKDEFEALMKLGGQPVGKAWEGFSGLLDSDKDGKISKAEFDKANAIAEKAEKASSKKSKDSKSESKSSSKSSSDSSKSSSSDSKKSSSSNSSEKKSG